jgi:nucleoside-diphosphate-sugar epimerase
MGLLSSKSLPEPKSNYALLHLFTEELFKKLDNSCSAITLILRIPTIYGYPLHKNKIKRALLIPYDFPNQLIEKGVIKLNTAGLQKRNFCSNLKLGLIVSNWLKDDCSIISNVKGESTKSVRDFALDCISIYNNLTGNTGKLVCNQTNLQQPIDDFEIEVTIDDKEPFKLTDFIEDYFKLKIT